MTIATVPSFPLDPNNFTGPVRELAGPVRTGVVVLDAPFGEFARWLYIGATGNLSYIKWDGTTETLPGIAAGFWHPIHAIAINSAGTTISAAALRWGS
jgi:hypothetical protein